MTPEEEVKIFGGKEYQSNMGSEDSDVCTQDDFRTLCDRLTKKTIKKNVQIKKLTEELRKERRLCQILQHHVKFLGDQIETLEKSNVV